MSHGRGDEAGGCGEARGDGGGGGDVSLRVSGRGHRDLAELPGGLQTVLQRRHEGVIRALTQLLHYTRGMINHNLTAQHNIFMSFPCKILFYWIIMTCPAVWPICLVETVVEEGPDTDTEPLSAADLSDLLPISASEHGCWAFEGEFGCWIISLVFVSVFFDSPIELISTVLPSPLLRRMTGIPPAGRQIIIKDQGLGLGANFNHSGGLKERILWITSKFPRQISAEIIMSIALIMKAVSHRLCLVFLRLVSFSAMWLSVSCSVQPHHHLFLPNIIHCLHFLRDDFSQNHFELLKSSQ